MIAAPRRLVIAAAGLLAVVTAASVALVLTQPGAGASDDGVLGPGPVTVRLDIEHSRFEPDRVIVRPHTEVRFVVVNHDPIGHELIVGDGTVHAVHEHGTEPAHAPRPGEVSVPASGRASTTFVFHEPGEVLYACHLPGHFAYGMSGFVEVRKATSDSRPAS
ncbi:MAG: plastocyanin/azurin family copper-binding protein [Acidimicrobiia bacterium]